MEKLKAPSDGFATFKHWNAIGMYVKSGEKSTKKNDKGEILFGFSQVRPKLSGKWHSKIFDTFPVDQPH
jgi:hypothetical protein